MLFLGFLESLDRRIINLTAKTYKTNKTSTVVCRSPLRFLSQIEKIRFSIRYSMLLPVVIPSLFMEEDDDPLFMESG